MFLGIEKTWQDLITIQILRENIAKGENAVYYIKSFTELRDIIE